ncbi:hypothetical protein [Rhodococcus jostii]|uniref:hypothetical protein n=1 Tax=Rhodococcus jostii TaxID=132919 RepID=UPI00364B2F3B
MQDIAKKVTLDLAAQKLFVDGREFPWMISEEGPTLGGFGEDEINTVTLTFFAADAEIVPEDCDADSQ